MDDETMDRLAPYHRSLERLCDEREPVAAALVLYFPEEGENAVKPHLVSHFPTTDDMKIVEASTRRLCRVIMAHLGITSEVHIERSSPEREVEDG